MTSPNTRTEPPADEHPSIGELLSEVSTNLSDLMRQELELAKAELRQSATRVGKGAGMLGGAGMAANLALVFGSVAAWWAIGNATGRGWSGLIVAAIWAVIALVLALVGRQEIRSVGGLPRTTESVKKIPDALKGDEPRTTAPTVDLTGAGAPAATGAAGPRGTTTPTGTTYPTGRPTTNQEDLR